MCLRTAADPDQRGIQRLCSSHIRRHYLTQYKPPTTEARRIETISRFKPGSHLVHARERERERGGAGPTVLARYPSNTQSTGVGMIFSEVSEFFRATLGTHHLQGGPCPSEFIDDLNPVLLNLPLPTTETSLTDKPSHNGISAFPVLATTLPGAGLRVMATAAARVGVKKLSTFGKSRLNQALDGPNP